MSKFVIYCPINCEQFCLQEIKGKIPNISTEFYSLIISDRGILSFEADIQSIDEFKHWTNIFSNCFTIEKLRLELRSQEIPSELQALTTRKAARVKFLEKNISIALKMLLKISTARSITLNSNLQHWKDVSQREIQGIFKKIVNEHTSLQFNLKEGEIEVHITLTPHYLKVAVDLPVQTTFHQLKAHPTPVFPSVAFVMIQLGLEQIPEAQRFMDAMCGAGNIALMVTQIIKDSSNLFVGGFDKDPNWIAIAQDNSIFLKSSPEIEFKVFDLLSYDFKSTFPFSNIDVFLAHPPYSHFVQYSNEILEQIYHNLFIVFQEYSNKKACLIINSPRSDILMPLINKFSLLILKIVEVPRKTTVVKLWVLARK